MARFPINFSYQYWVFTTYFRWK